ncbi:hypothetical protein DIC82_11560 [Clostridium beijerinckii]|nr:hypothetical protein DIC82_11560 [Clostridium beijerinckii]
MSNKKNNLFIAVLITIILIAIPILLDKFIIGNNWPSNISNSEWVSFLGSYLGGLFGGVLSIAGVFITIRYYKQQEIKEKEERQKFILEEIKKQHEIKYKFECLEELEAFNRKIGELYNHIEVIDMLIEEIPKDEKPLNKIDHKIWENFSEISKDINKSYNNLKSIYECKLSVFYKHK